MDPPGESAALEVVRGEMAVLPFSGNQRELGVHIPPTQPLRVPASAPVGGEGDDADQELQKERRRQERGPGLAAWRPRCGETARRGGGPRAELTRARRGQSEARNGTFPPGVSCQSVREHGTVAKGAAALYRGRETGLQNLSPPSKSNFQRALKLNEFQKKSSQDRGL